MPLLPSTGTVASPSIHVIGREVIPSYMLEKAHPQAVESAPPQAAPSGGSWIEDVFNTGVGYATDLWNSAWEYKSLYDYWRYSSSLQASFEANHAPYDLHRMVYDAKGRAILPSAATLARSEGQGVSRDAAVNNAYEYSGVIFEFFKQRLGYVIQEPMMQVVNYNDNDEIMGFDNAYFSPMDMGLSIMYYGTGDHKYFKSADGDITVIAHEMAHNFIDGKYGAKFTYFGKHYGQPGAINEHIADVIAKCVQAAYMTDIGEEGWDDGVGDWFIGANFMVNPDFCLRDMWMPGNAYNDPGLGKDPQKGHMRDFAVTGEDHGGVHLNNGIMNRLFAEFCMNAGGAIYETPLNVWLKAMDICDPSPSFHSFAQALRVAARQYDVEDEFMKAAKLTGVLDYVVLDGEVVPVGGVTDAGESDVLSEDTGMALAG